MDNPYCSCKLARVRRWSKDPEEVRCWDELKLEQQQAAIALGYDHWSWDSAMREDLPPPDDGEKSMFVGDEECYAFDKFGNAFVSKVVSVRRSKDPDAWEYLAHYKGWKTKWDEWMFADRVFKFTEDNKRMCGDQLQGSEQTHRKQRRVCLPKTHN